MQVVTMAKAVIFYIGGEILKIIIEVIALIIF